MASEKNERLVNLVIALIAAKRYWTKEQIFNAIEGYKGSAEAKDRMFERDKEELRSLGIQIEMKSLDPLFDDEVGYRISPDRYKFDLGPLSKKEIALLALAAEAWSESVLSDLAKSTAIRLESLGISADFEELPLQQRISNTPENLAQVLDAVNGDRVIEFSYIGNDDSVELRRVEPHGLYSSDHRWYLYAFDEKHGEMRSYRLDRFVGEIKKQNKTFQRREFQLPKSHFETIDTVLEIRRDFSSEITNRGQLVKEGDEWNTWKVSFPSHNVALAAVLRNTPNVKVLQPRELVDAVMGALDELVREHG